MGKKAVIDIGTNSVRMLIGELINGRPNVFLKDVITTRLGEGVHHNGVLGEGPMERTILALEKFCKMSSEWNVATITCFATSAVRDAENRDIFIDRVKDRLGIDVKVLSGQEEARVAYVGGIMDLEAVTNERIALIDIGGGSTELILGRGKYVERTWSLNIGAVRLTELYPLCYPVLQEKWQSMGQHIDREIPREWSKEEKHVSALIGVGGTITSLAAIDQELEHYDPAKVQGYELSLDKINDILVRLIDVSPEDRKKVAGLQPERADIILAGIHILTKVMKRLCIDRIRVSDHDNLEGMMYLENELE